MSFTLKAYHAPDFDVPALRDAPDAQLAPVVKDGVAPAGYHALGISPEYFKVNGRWILARESRMDCVPVLRSPEEIEVVEFRRLKAGDRVFLGRTEDGSQGIYVHFDGFADPDEGPGQNFAFRQGRSRETGFSRDYREIAQLLQYEKEHGGFVSWVMGPAFAFDAAAREAFCKLIKNGYVQAVLAGNALATHDLEGAYLHTALGADIDSQTPLFNGHYHHLDTLNRVRECGSIPAFMKAEGLNDGIICTCVNENIPFVLVGSVRDDGPLPETTGNVYEGQDAMRAQVRKSTTVIGMATVLHTIATGNMTPSFRVLADGTIRPVYFYTVDVSEFAVNKLSDRGSLLAKGIVANVQDFVTKVAAELGL